MRGLLYNIKSRAQRNGIEFSLTEDDIQIPEVCPALGIPMSQGSGIVWDGSPSIDRLDPSKGYTPQNVRVISYRANRIKNNATAEELEAVARWLRSEGMN